MKNDEVLFFEYQRLSRIFLLVIFVPANMLFLFGCYTQLIRGIPWGNNPAPDAVLIIITAFMILLSVNMLKMNLKTVVNSEGVQIRLWIFPFYIKTKTFLWEEMSRVYIRKYRPMWEYGGWGYRTWIGGTAYNMSGNIGLQLVLRNKEKVLIGTNKHEELFEVLQKLGKAE